jgi:hypothetical protein
MRDTPRLRPAAIAAVACLLAALAFCSDLLLRPGGWGRHDWDFFFWTHLAACRSLFEFREWPLWNPWTVGGFPSLGNPQSQVLNPWFLADLALGPVLAFKVVIVAHYAICLGGTYWLGRELGMSRLAAAYAAGTFTFSTWLALRVFAGHFTYLTLAYMPWVVGLVHRARHTWKAVVPGALVLGLMLLNGTWEVVFAAIVAGLMAVLWGVQGRTLRPVAALALMGALGCGVGAAKLVPVIDLMRVHQRVVETATKLGVDRLKAAPDAAERRKADEFEGFADIQVIHGSWGEGTRLEPLAMIVKAFFGREQRGIAIYYVRSSLWHEYGAYLGILGAALCVAALAVRRDAWPWMLVGGFCFVMGLGNFSRFAPWYLLHDLPILRSMHTAPRFFTLALFAGCMLAGLTLDAVRDRLRRREEAGRRRLSWVVPVLVAVALVDSVLVGRYTLHGTFDQAPPPVPGRLPEPRTVTGNSWKTTPLMLSNRTIKNGYEPLKLPTSVHAEGEPGYRGEHYFVADGPTSGVETAGTTRLEAWSPNTARVRVEVGGPGRVVLNRNWDKGWRAKPPFAAVPHEGLVAVAVPAGTHTVELSYHAPPVAVGVVVSLVSLGVCLLATLAGRRRPTADPAAPPPVPS